MNILLINHYAGSPQYGMEYRPYYLAREWVNEGHKVQIIASSHSHVRNLQPRMPGDSILNEKIDEINYRWHRTPKYKGNGPGRVVNILSFVFSLWRYKQQIVERFQPDVVIASSTYPMDIWPARSIAKLAKAKLVFEVHDLWPLSPIELGGMSPWHPFIILCQRAEDFAYRHADKVVSILPNAKEYMESRGMSAEKFYCVTNGIDKEEWKNIQSLPITIREELERIKSRGLPIVGYAGAHGLANSLDALLDAAKQAKNQFEVVLVGMGPEREDLLKRVENERITNVTMLPAIPKATIPAFLKEIDIAFIGLLPQPLFRFGISPNKLMDYMMAGKPIVMAIKAGNDMVAEAGCGVTVAPGNPSAICNGIQQLAEMTPEARKEMGEKGKRFILKNYTYPILAKRFIEILNS